MESESTSTSQTARSARAPRRARASAAPLPDAGCGHAPHGVAAGCEPDPHSLVKAAAMFKALADPERLRLLVRLAGGEACVSELAEAGKVTTVSARLQALHAVRLVRRRRDARHVYYALADEHVLELVTNAMDHAGEGRIEPVPRTVPTPGSEPKGPSR